MPTESDIELMLRVREGDTDAFAALMERYRPRLTSFYRRLGVGGDAAEDLLQETFIRLWQARERYRPAARFSTYLMEIARNLWLNERERIRRRPEIETPPAGAPDALEVARADIASQPEEVALARERRRRVLAAIDALPDKHRLVFILSHFEGMRYREIAESLGVAEGTVKYHMHEAVHALRRMLDGLLEE